MRSKLEKIRPHAAGIDIGAAKVFVSVEDEPVAKFETFTAEFYRLVDYLVKHKVESVAMEATGVYWIVLHDMIEQAGMEVYVVNASHVRMVPGRKTDVQDCQWLQQLHSFGLLSKSMIPDSSFRELRTFSRLRQDHIERGAEQVNKMQKALTMMNIRLKEVIAEIHGASGMRIIKAILGGERDPETLAALCETSILKKKREAVVASLHGFYNAANLFELRQAVESYEFIRMQISACDGELEIILLSLTQGMDEPQESATRKRIRRNTPQIADLHKKVSMLSGGVDLTVLPGLTDYNTLKILSETGNDLKRWASFKQFTSWCGLSPGKNTSGKMRGRSKRRLNTKVGQIFKEAAQTLINSKDCAIGAFIRRLRGKKGSPIAIKAGARKLAEMFWNLMTKGMEFVEKGIKEYEEKLIAQQRRYLERKARELNLQLVDIQHA